MCGHLGDAAGAPVAGVPASELERESAPHTTDLGVDHFPFDDPGVSRTIFRGDHRNGRDEIDTRIGLENDLTRSASPSIKESPLQSPLRGPADDLKFIHFAQLLLS